MSTKFNKLFVQLDCKSLFPTRPDRPLMIEATYAFFMDVESSNGYAPKNAVLTEIFDDAAKYRFHLNPNLKRRLPGRQTPWLENRFNTDFQLETSDTLYHEVSLLINSRFDTLVHLSALRSIYYAKKLYKEFVPEEHSFPAADDECVPLSGDCLRFPALREKLDRTPETAVKPFPDVCDLPYIRESKDFLNDDTLEVTMVHCSSINDVLIAYSKYSGHTKLGRSL